MESPKKMPADEPPVGWKTVGILLLAMAAVFLFVWWNRSAERAISSKNSGSQAAQFVLPAPGTWRFIVSGDSRNCGDVVMPAIATHSAQRYLPSFYWHLGDLRAIYKIDEDMAAASQKAGHYLSCETYLKRAWPDFIDNQIASFGITRFYLGIGNHETIQPKTAAEFSAQFEDWLMTPRRQMERAERDEIAAAKDGPCKNVAAKPYLAALPYYHWVQEGVDFIYLDNSSVVFSSDQLEWFDCILARAENNNKVRTVVVGMHETLPNSIASDHGMCDTAIKDPKKKEESCKSGEHVYEALLKLQAKKNVYVLASHSHFYLQGIFDNAPPDRRLPGWIVGTAGAVRYPLPANVQPGPAAQTDVYGYLLATAHSDGKIDFQFKEVQEADVPDEVRQRYPSSFVNWCFAHNSEHKDPASPETTNRCIPPPTTAGKGPSSQKP